MLNNFVHNDAGNIHDMLDILVHMTKHIQHSEKDFNIWRVYVEDIVQIELETLLIAVSIVSLYL